MEIFRLFGRIMIDDKEAQSSLSKTEKNAEGLAKRFGGMIKTAAKWGAAIVGGAIAAGAAIGGLATPLVKAAAEMNALNAQFEQVFQDLQDEAQASIDRLGKNFGMLPNRIKPSFTQMTSMFKGLGLDTAEAMKQAETAVTLVADAAAFYDMSFEQANQHLNSFIKGNYEGGEAIGLFANETQMAAWAAKNLGLDWKNLDEAGKQVARLEYAKAMQEAAGATGQAARESDALENQLGNLRQAWQDFKARLGEPILEPAIHMIQTLSNWLSTVDVQPIVDGITRFGEVVTSVFDMVVPFIQQSLSTILSYWQQNGQQIMESAQGAFDTVKQIIMFVVGLIASFIQDRLKLIRQFWDENGQQIMQAVSNAFKFIQSVIQTTMPIIQFIIEQVWGVIQGIFDGALKVIMGLLKTFAGLFTGDWRKMWEGIKQMISGALQFIWNLINLTLLGRALGAIRSFGSQLMAAFKTPFNWVKNFINTILNAITSRAKSFASQFTGAFKAIPNGIRAVLNRIISGFNSLVGRLNRFSISIPDWVPAIGGKSFKINIPTIPGLARGGVVTRSGSVLVGEAGPEILNLPRGASVIPLDHPSAGMDYDRLAEALARHMKPSVVFNNHFSVGESTPSQYLRKQRQLAREWGLNY